MAEEDLDVLLPLVRAYCAFYEVAPADADLLAVSRALIADPREGTQFLARDTTAPSRPAVGFATVFWTWTTTRAGRLAVMNDLYVAPDARGAGIAEALVDACRSEAVRGGAVSLDWVTAPDNRRAQAVYDRVGGVASTWVRYTLVPGPGPSSSSAQPER